jgi:hypothetical protein
LLAPISKYQPLITAINLSKLHLIVTIHSDMKSTNAYFKDHLRICTPVVNFIEPTYECF